MKAMRLALTLVEYEKTNTPITNALIALMCFHASRFDARQSTTEDSLVLYEQQDEQLWDQELINRGKHFLYIYQHREMS